MRYGVEIKTKNQAIEEMLSDITIDDASETDLPFIGVLVLELAESVDVSEGANLEVIQRNFVSLLGKRDSKILVAKLGRKLVGFIHLTIRLTLFHPKFCCLIEELIIAKGHRGQGIGTFLLTETINRCQQLGCCEIEVSTAEKNTKARDFYEHCGFYECGVVFGKHW